LINNSIKFIPNEKVGKISILLENRTKDKDYKFKENDSNTLNQLAVISVKDNGIGIDKDILPLLFTKFASKLFQETGLGLYICKNIIEAHGGKIWAKNNKCQKGSTVSFSLPVENKYNFNNI